MLIFANKQDVPGALNCEEITQFLGLNSESPESIGSHRHWKIVSCSAVTGQGLLDGIDWIVGDISSRIFMLE